MRCLAIELDCHCATISGIEASAHVVEISSRFEIRRVTQNLLFRFDPRGNSSVCSIENELTWTGWISA